MKGDCGCGCGLFGTIRKNGHVRACNCKRCMGARNRRGGLRKQRAAAKALGVPRSRMNPGNEEFFGGALRCEIKSGRQVAALFDRLVDAGLAPGVVVEAEGYLAVRTDCLMEWTENLCRVNAVNRVRGLSRWYTTALTQANNNRVLGDVRPFVFVAMPPGVSFGVVVCAVSDEHAVKAGWRENVDQLFG